MIVQGNIVDIQNKAIFKGEVEVKNGKIKAVRKSNHFVENYILPGFVDAHIHIESSMLNLFVANLQRIEKDFVNSK